MEDAPLTDSEGHSNRTRIETATPAAHPHVVPYSEGHSNRTRIETKQRRGRETMTSVTQKVIPIEQGLKHNVGAFQMQNQKLRRSFQ